MAGIIHLPTPTGTHTVGCTDLISKYGRDRILSRLFYPTCDKLQKSALPLWLPEKAYVRSLANLKSMNDFTWALNFRLNFALMPVVQNGRLQKPDKDNDFPVLIVSHAWGSNRFMHSAICSDLASYGMIVAVLEHADHSASATFYLENDMTDDTKLSAKKKWVNFVKFDEDIGDPLFKMQLDARIDDCIILLNLLKDINKASFNDLDLHCDIDLSLFENSLNINQVGIMGHGFGGTTAVSAVHKNSRFCYGISLDGLMTFLEDDLHEKQSLAPIFFLNSSDQNRSFENIAETLTLALKPTVDGTEHTMVTLEETVIMSHTDFPLLINKIAGTRFRLCGNSDPFLVQKVESKLLLGFIGEQLGKDYGSTMLETMETQAELISPGINMEAGGSKNDKEKLKLQPFL